MNKWRAFGWSRNNKAHLLKTLALRNSSSVVRHSNLERNVVSRGHVVKIRNYSAATSLYTNMCIEGIRVSSTTLNILMHCFCLEGKVDSGFSLLGAFFKRGIVPDATTFNALLRGLLRDNRISDAEELGWKIADHQLCQPNVVMLWIVTNGLTKADSWLPHHFDIATMKSHDESCTDQLVYEKKLDAALGVFGKMIEDGIAPGPNSYESLLRRFCSLGSWNKVKRLWNQVLSFNIQPDLITYDILIHSFAKHGLMKDPMHVFKTRCTTTYDRLIDLCCVEGQVNEARRIIDTVVANGCVPGISTFNFILEELLQSGRCDMAKDFFNELQPNFDTYCVMLDGLCKNGLDNKALQLLEKLEKEGVELPMTMFSMILDELRKRGIFRSVLLKRMRVSTSGDALDNIISGLCEHGLLEEAKVLFDQMECICKSTCVEFVNKIVLGLVEGGKYKDVVAYIDKMVGKEFGLDSSNMSHVLEMISKMENDLVPFQNLLNFNFQSVKATKTTSTRLDFRRWLDFRISYLRWEKDRMQPGIQYLTQGLRCDQKGGNPERALKFASMALKDLDAKPSLDVATCLHLLGSVCCRLQRFDDSFKYLERAIEILGQLEEERCCSGDDIKPILHAVHSEMFTAKKGLELKESMMECMESSSLGDVNRHVAEAYLGALNFKEAKRYCLKALEMHSRAPLKMARDRRLLSVIESGYELDRNAPLCQRMEFEGWVNLWPCESKDSHYDWSYKGLNTYDRETFSLISELRVDIRSATRDIANDLESGAEKLRNVYIRSATRDIANDLESGAEKLRNVLNKTNKDSEEMIYAMIFVSMARALLCDHGDRESWKQHKFGESKRWLVMATDIVSKNQLTWPLAVVEAYEEISVAYETMEEFQTAIWLLKKARRMAVEIPDRERISYANTVQVKTSEEIVLVLDARIGWLQLEAGEYHNAAAILEKTTQRMKQCFGDEDRRLAYAYNNLGVAYFYLGMVEPSAARAFAHAKDIFCAVYGPRHTYSIDAFRNFSDAYAAMEDCQGAIKFQEEVIESLEWEYEQYCERYVTMDLRKVEHENKEFHYRVALKKLKILLAEIEKSRNVNIKGSHLSKKLLTAIMEKKETIEQSKVQLEQLKIKAQGDALYDIVFRIKALRMCNFKIS